MAAITRFLDTGIHITLPESVTVFLGAIGILWFFWRR